MRGRRGLIADALGDHRLFALAALHAARMRVAGTVPDGVGGYILAMPLAMIPLAIVLDWFAINVAWASDFVILKIIFTLPGLVCTALAIIGLIAWIVFAAMIFAHVVAYVGARLRRRRA